MAVEATVVYLHVSGDIVPTIMMPCSVMLDTVGRLGVYAGTLAPTNCCRWPAGVRGAYVGAIVPQEASVSRTVEA